MLELNTVHRGDCLELMRGIPDGSVDMVLADPPYGTTACKWDSIIPLEPMWEQLKRVIKLNGAIVMTASQPFTTKLISSNMDWFKYCWVWDKVNIGNPFLATTQPLKQHEDVVVFLGGKYNPIMEPRRKNRIYQDKYGGGESFGKRGTGSKVYKLTEKYPKSILRISNSSQINKSHPTQKPVALMGYLIRTYTNEGDTVLDFCCGSGTTGVACKRWGRNFILIEREAEYCDIARRRLEAEDNLFTEAVG